jgi:hypothetical protein
MHSKIPDDGIHDIPRMCDANKRPFDWRYDEAEMVQAIPEFNQSSRITSLKFTMVFGRYSITTPRRNDRPKLRTIRAGRRGQSSQCYSCDYGTRGLRNRVHRRAMLAKLLVDSIVLGDSKMYKTASDGPLEHTKHSNLRMRLLRSSVRYI